MPNTCFIWQLVWQPSLEEIKFLWKKYLLYPLNTWRGNLETKPKIVVKSDFKTFYSRLGIVQPKTGIEIDDMNDMNDMATQWIE